MELEKKLEVSERDVMLLSFTICKSLFHERPRDGKRVESGDNRKGKPQPSTFVERKNFGFSLGLKVGGIDPG
jgi:hypothetical protein